MAGIHRDAELEHTLQQALDDGNSVWAIGDVHGHKETLEALIGRLGLSEGDHVICMGDLIDRGPDILGVLRLVEGSDNIHSIRGNHEEMLRLSVSPEHGHMMKSWLKYGGADTLNSFSDDHEEQIGVASGWLPFIESLPTELVLRDHRLVHGGYDLSKTLEDQNNQDRMWSRGIFQAKAPVDDERQIIVGHTTVQALLGPEAEGIWSSESMLADGRPAVLGVDTGVFMAEEARPRLTALNLQDGEVRSQSRAER